MKTVSKNAKHVAQRSIETADALEGARRECNLSSRTHLITSEIEKNRDRVLKSHFAKKEREIPAWTTSRTNIRRSRLQRQRMQKRSPERTTVARRGNAPESSKSTKK
jgi:hypothetical protein